MAFDKKRFTKSKYVPRTVDIPAIGLEEFFGPDEKPVWTVRGLSGYEVGRAKERAANTDRMLSIIKGILGNVPDEISASMKKIMGADRAETPEDIAYRMYMLLDGSVSPSLVDEAGNEDMDIVIKLVTIHSTLFYRLTNKIDELTGMGYMPGKPNPSGDVKTSELP